MTRTLPGKQDAEHPEAGGREADELSSLREQEQAWEAFATYAVRLIPVLRAQMTAVTDETERAALDVLVHLRVLASSEAMVTPEDRAASLSKVVMAVQVQDITRQKLEHIGQVLEQWNQHLQALARGRQGESTKREIAALQQVERYYTMEEERRLHAAALNPDYQEPVPTDTLDTDPDSVTLF
jgi:hypothetical protein